MLALLLMAASGARGQLPPRPVKLGDSGLMMTLPAGWRVADKSPDHAQTFGAYQSPDRRASWFISSAKAPDQADMTQIMRGVIANFESAFIVNRVGELKTGPLADSPAVFTTLEAEMRAANSPDRLPFRFYLAVIDTGRALYLVQASVQAPIDAKREGEILAMLRSLKQSP